MKGDIRQVTETVLWQASEDFLTKHNLEKLEVFASSHMTAVYLEYWSAWSCVNTRQVACDCDSEIDYSTIDAGMIERISSEIDKVIDGVWSKRPSDDKCLFMFASELAQVAEKIVMICQWQKETA